MSLNACPSAKPACHLLMAKKMRPSEAWAHSGRLDRTLYHILQKGGHGFRGEGRIGGAYEDRQKLPCSQNRTGKPLLIAESA